MDRNVLLLVIAGCLSIAPLASGDFKYTETSQITGGALASMMKGLGVFSKSARQATKPMDSITYVKGSQMRKDNADGTYQIIDLDGRRIIEVNPAGRTYSVMTFEQMRQVLEQMQQRLHEQMQKQSQENNTNVSITPKIEVKPTGKTQNILGQDTQEMLLNMELQMQATDAEHGTQSGSISTEMDSWIAPSVSGYQEISDFYKKMATEIGWTPNSISADPRVSQSMVELYKSGKIPSGLPMLTTLSLVPSVQPSGQAAQQSQQQQSHQQPPPQEEQSASISDISSPSAAAAKALGGMFGRRHTKKQEDDEQAGSQAQSSAAPANSLITITTRVSSFSSDPLDASLFQIPSGFTQVESQMQQRMEKPAQ